MKLRAHSRGRAKIKEGWGGCSQVTSPRTCSKLWLITQTQQPQWPPATLLGKGSFTFWTSRVFLNSSVAPTMRNKLFCRQDLNELSCHRAHGLTLNKGSLESSDPPSSHFLLSLILFSPWGMGICAAGVINSAGTIISGRKGMEIIFGI